MTVIKTYECENCGAIISIEDTYVTNNNYNECPVCFKKNLKFIKSSTTNEK